MGTSSSRVGSPAYVRDLFLNILSQPEASVFKGVTEATNRLNPEQRAQFGNFRGALHNSFSTTDNDFDANGLINKSAIRRFLGLYKLSATGMHQLVSEIMHKNMGRPIEDFEEKIATLRQKLDDDKNIILGLARASLEVEDQLVDQLHKDIKALLA